MSLGFSFELTDFYCGAGGSSTGAVMAGAEIKNAANHWRRAIETHQHNHPATKHYLMDIREADPHSFPHTPVAWFSPTCNAHTISSGRKRKDDGQLSMFDDDDADMERERATMSDVIRFSRHHRYEAVIVENVVDVKYWRHIHTWYREMESLGYEHKTCYFNSMFFHPLNEQSDFAPQSRDRWYVVFWKKGNRAPDLDFRPLAYCQRCGHDVKAIQVFKKPVFPRGVYDSTGKRGQYYYACPEHEGRVEPYYFAALNCIDFSLPITRISDRKKPLRPNTMKRITIGLEKYGNQSLIIRLTRSHAKNNWTTRLVDAIPTQTTRQSLAFIAQIKGPPEYMYFKPALAPVPTQTTSGTPGLLIVEMYGGGDCRPASEPLNTVTAGGRKSGIVIPGAFISSYYTRNDTASGLDKPLPTVPGQNRFALVSPAFLMSYNGNGVVSGLDAPVGTVTTVDRHAFVVNMQAGNRPTSVVEPLPAVLTRNHKYLVESKEKITVEDCFFRMLEPDEVKDAQGFPEQYDVLGNKREQVKQIGGAVSPPVAEYLVAAVRDSLS